MRAPVKTLTGNRGLRRLGITKPAAGTIGGKILRDSLIVATGVIIVLAIFDLTILIPKMVALQSAMGVEFQQILDHSRRWLSGGNYYLDRQLQGPYRWMGGESLYPPPMALFVGAFTVLPEVLWWAVPLTVITLSLVRSRPAIWAWPILAAVFWYPRTQELILYGNPSMWVAAAVAAGTIWGWPAVGVILKPTLAPLALVGAWRRSWWVALASLGLIGLAFGAMWLDYVRVVINSAQSWGQSWDYSLRDVPLCLAPLVACLSGPRRVLPWGFIMSLRARLQPA